VADDLMQASNGLKFAPILPCNTARRGYSSAASARSHQTIHPIAFELLKAFGAYFIDPITAITPLGMCEVFVPASVR
jgi:hypothetical protein